MKDEIKEILDKLKGQDNDYHYCLKKDISFNDNMYCSHILLDYITNLQKENDNLKDFNNKLQATKDRLDKYDRENTMLIENYKSRIEKAIEYIKEDMYVEPNELYGLVDGEHLLNILQGVGK